MTDNNGNVVMPGALRSEANLFLQTRQAQHLVLGRRAAEDKPAIVGLMRFAGLMRQVWVGAKGGDPYAHWWLVKVDDAMNEASTDMKNLGQQINAQIAEQPGVDIQTAESVEPVKFPLKFNNPYGYHGAYLLADYDEVIRVILTARHVGILDSQAANKALKEAGRIMRRALMASTGYKFFGVKTKDVADGTSQAEDAKRMMGEIPADVLSGEQRSPHAPSAGTGLKMGGGLSLGTPGKLSKAAA